MSIGNMIHKEEHKHQNHEPIQIKYDAEFDIKVHYCIDRIFV